LHELPGATDETASNVVPERDLLVRELRDFVLALAREQRLLIAVDDFDRIDEPSMAVLAALAYKAERDPLIVALTIEHDGGFAASPALRLLRSVCDNVALEPLSEEQTEALVRALFGDVPNLKLVAGRLHALAQGNPRATMELAQHLVTSGVVRYRLGGFALPEMLGEGELPATFLSALDQRLGRLSADARELCDALFITDDDAPTVTTYAQLTRHDDPDRVFAALDELVALRVLIADGDRYRFSHRGFHAAVAAALVPTRVAAMHVRAAHWLAETGGHVLRRAHHLLASGDHDVEAIELIAATDYNRDHAPLPLLERAIARAERHGLSRRTILRLHAILLHEAQGIPEITCFKVNVGPVLEQLVRDSGLGLLRELTDVPAEHRIGQALALAHQRYQTTPEHERGYSVADAIPELGRLAMMFHAIGIASLDIQMWDPLPSLEPLAPLSPALSVIERFGEASRAWVEGRFVRSVTIYRELLQRIDQPDRAGLLHATHARMRIGLHLLLGLRSAADGSDQGELHARVLDEDRLFRVTAWRVRQVMHLARGDVEQARRCMRRAEALQVQVGGEQHALGASFAIELMTMAVIGDLVGLRAATERVATMVERMPAWQPVLAYGQVKLRQLQGDSHGALGELLDVLELAPAGRHWCFGPLAICHVGLLTELGRFDEACATGSEYLAVCEREDLLAPYGIHIGLVLALARARAGQSDAAVELADRMIVNLGAVDSSTLQLGVAFEIRSRIALVMKDATAFERFAALCGREFGRGKNPVLAARFARLLDEARSATNTSIVPSAELEALSSEHSESEYASIHSRIEECADRDDRARCALTILLQQMESFAGHLYGVNEDAVVLLAGLPEHAPPEELDDWVRRWTAAEIEAGGGELTTDECQALSAEPPASRHVDADGRRFAPVPLFARDAGATRLAAVLAVHLERAEHSASARELATKIASQLIAHG
ncbi:MAG TPA: hypothetical protein VK509_01265, partial [Polyangiales bacterium]|nr:hypothetical protein [Polyangiales bacterium]